MARFIDDFEPVPQIAAMRLAGYTYPQEPVPAHITDGITELKRRLCLTAEHRTIRKVPSTWDEDMTLAKTAKLRLLDTLLGELQDVAMANGPSHPETVAKMVGILSLRSRKNRNKLAAGNVGLGWTPYVPAVRKLMYPSLSLDHGDGEIIANWLADRHAEVAVRLIGWHDCLTEWDLHFSDEDDANRCMPGLTAMMAAWHGGKHGSVPQ